MPGTLLYRTSGQGKMYGFSSKDLIREKYGVITNIYSGHAAIYIGKEDGVDYIVEALGTGIVKTPAKYFVNDSEGEVLVAAKIPKKATSWQRAKAVAIAKYLSEADLAYDFDFSDQKGPWSGDWTCVGLTEKLYESANADNPNGSGRWNMIRAIMPSTLLPTVTILKAHTITKPEIYFRKPKNTRK